MRVCFQMQGSRPESNRASRERSECCRYSPLLQGNKFAGLAGRKASWSLRKSDSYLGVRGYPTGRGDETCGSLPGATLKNKWPTCFCVCFRNPPNGCRVLPFIYNVNQLPYSTKQNRTRHEIRPRRQGHKTKNL